MGGGIRMRGNYHIKISLPLKIVEKLDKLTTYKGRSRSKYIANALTQRLEGSNAEFEDLDLNRCLSLAHSRFGNSPRDLLMREIIHNYLYPVDYTEKKPDSK